MTDITQTNTAPPTDFDVTVVGAGMGGIYAIHHLTDLGFSVQCFEGASGVGGVWFHNRYPGARVDVESTNYCFPDPELIAGWTWTERYPAQPEILAYLEYAADRWDVRRHIRFNSRVASAHWDDEARLYRITTEAGDESTSRFLVMATGQLSEARKPNFPGIDDFTGSWVLTSHWPEEGLDLDGKRVGVVGTGSSGVQTVTAIAPMVGSLYVFQRTANYSVPAHNRPLDPEVLEHHKASAPNLKADLLRRFNAMHMPGPEVSAHDMDDDERLALLDERWQYGGHTLNLVFTDQNTDPDVNAIVAGYVRAKVAERVTDPNLAETLTPTAYPIGTRRLIVDTGYYETFNRDNVHLVNIDTDPIAAITPTGVQTNSAHIDLDVLIFAIGFDAFTGALDAIDLRNKDGLNPTTRWARGPQTYLGLMTADAPNLFVLTGPGSPSVLSNMIIGNVHHVDMVGEILTHMRDNNFVAVEPTHEAEKEWTAHVANVSAALIRRDVENYMVHVNEDGSRVFIPYAGGFDRYVRTCSSIVDAGFTGLEFKE